MRHEPRGKKEKENEISLQAKKNRKKARSEERKTKKQKNKHQRHSPLAHCQIPPLVSSFLQAFLMTTPAQ